MVCDWCMIVGVLNLYKRHARTLRLPSLDANMFQLTEPGHRKLIVGLLSGPAAQVGEGGRKKFQNTPNTGF